MGSKKKNDEIIKRMSDRAFGLIKMESATGGIRLDILLEESLAATHRMIKFLEHLEKNESDMNRVVDSGEYNGFDFIEMLRGAAKRRNAILYRKRGRDEAFTALHRAIAKNRPEKELKELRKEVQKHASEFLWEAYQIETEFSQIRVIAGEEMNVPEKPRSGRPPLANKYTREEDNF